MITAKFGGTSVGAAPQVITIGKIVKKELARQPVIVVSALAGVTNLLLDLTTARNKSSVLREIKNKHLNLINKLFKKPLKKEVLKYIGKNLAELEKLSRLKNFNKQNIDKILSHGEILSSFIITSYLKSQNIDAEQVISTSLIVTNDNFGHAEFLPKPTEKLTKKILRPLIRKKIVPVVTGFLGATKKGATTTLGRGGSDYSASIIGFCLNAEEIQIWTDVDGIYTADPRITKNARPIPMISYKEASELAAFGAKVLHPRTIKPAVRKNIPLRVLNTLNPNCKGTLISQNTDSTRPITAISFKRKITLVNIYSTDMLFTKGYLAKIFSIFTKYNVSIDIVSVSEVSVSLTIENEEMLDSVVQDLSKFSAVTVRKDLGMISLIGEGMAGSGNSVSKIFEILDKEKINIKMISLGATDINISVVVKYDEVERAVVKLHNNLLIKKLPIFKKTA